MKHYIFFIAILALNISANVQFSSPKVEINDFGETLISLEFKAEAIIDEKDIILLSYKSDSPINYDNIKFQLLEDLEKYQRLTIALNESFYEDFFSFRIRIGEETKKDIFIFLPSNTRRILEKRKSNNDFKIPAKKIYGQPRVYEERASETESNLIEDGNIVIDENEDIDLFKTGNDKKEVAETIFSLSRSSSDEEIIIEETEELLIEETEEIIIEEAEDIELSKISEEKNETPEIIEDSPKELKVKAEEIDTIWSISKGFVNEYEASIYQIMWSIFLENPESFIDGNINLVRADLDLVIPPKEIVDSVDLDYAKSAFIQMNNAFENMNKSRLVLTAPKNIIQVESSNSDQLSESPTNIINPNLSSPKEIVESNLRIINFESKTTLKQTNDVPQINQNNLLQILIVGLASFILGAIISIFLIRKRQPRINETTDSTYADQIIDNELSIENDNEMQMLDLARIYIEMGSYDDAKGILDQLISNSNNLQIQADASLLKNKLEN